ncbi:MAG: hypothetical protein ACRDNY_09990 [Gaiellaceae bacterium]
MGLELTLCDSPERRDDRVLAIREDVGPRAGLRLRLPARRRRSTEPRERVRLCETGALAHGERGIDEHELGTDDVSVDRGHVGVIGLSVVLLKRKLPEVAPRRIVTARSLRAELAPHLLESEG